MRRSYCYLWALCSLVLSSYAFAPLLLTQRRSSVLWGGGFGDAAASANKKEAKLKPKQQWDRYIALKKEPSVPVGVRVVGLSTDSKDDDWLQVGAVKRQAEISIDVAVARQRALIVEHAKRLYPLQISTKAQVEWGYRNEENAWLVVDKSVLESVQDAGIEKNMGFEGTPDPTTGFYCVYNEGRLVKSTDGELNPRPSSKKLG